MKTTKKLSIYTNLMMGLMQRKYSKVWDDLLEDILNHGELIEFKYSCVVISFGEDTYTIWLENFPYAYAHLWKKNDQYIDRDFQFRPSIKNMIRLFDFAFESQEKIRIERERFAIRHVYGANHE